MHTMNDTTGPRGKRGDIEILLSAYAQGLFPMADSRKGKTLRWYSPEQRGVIPLDAFHVPKSLAKFLKKAPFTYRGNTAFHEVITACAERGETWINDEIIALYSELNRLGFAHSVEVWQPSSLRPRTYPAPVAGCGGSNPELDRHVAIAPRDDDTLVGGLYGVSLGGAFFGESMFSRSSNASKAALVHLVRLLKEKGYTLLDAQYVNEHLLQFGIQEIPREEYLLKLYAALALSPQPFN